MAATVPETMVVDKGYWQTRRGAGHSRWEFGFWRELFQNEVDAGAKHVAITVDYADGKGSFGQDPEVGRVLRVTFEGDGHGMDEDVIRKVFLNPGRTTKTGDGFQGGFGTARIMLCFSQVRYSVRTQDWLVEGNGSEFLCKTLPEARELRRAELSHAIEAGGSKERIGYLEADLRELDATPDHTKGARFEIDIDPNEFPDRYRNVDKDKLLAALDDYLSLSQLPCDVIVNGVPSNSEAMRGPVKRELVADIDGVQTVFATVHTSKGEKAKHKGKLVVRSGGAAMHVREIGGGTQAILELAPALARSVLTDNRDGIRDPFSSVVDGFTAELTTDLREALKKKEDRKHSVVEGKLGQQFVKLDVRSPPTNEEMVAMAELARSVPTGNEEVVTDRYGASRDGLERLVDAARGGDTALVDAIVARTGLTDSAGRFKAAAEAGDVEQAIGNLDGDFGSMVKGILAERERKLEEGVRSGMHDIHLQVDDLGGSAVLKEAVRRYSPNFWRAKGQSLEGRGIGAHMLLAAWNAAVREAVDCMLKIRPSLAKGGKFAFGTGFYFGADEESWDYDAKRYVPIRTGAMFQHREGKRLFLLNPVTAEGKPAFDLTDQASVRQLLALVKHEVAHTVGSGHDQEWGYMLTSLDAAFDVARVHEAMRKDVDAVRAIYGRGTTKVQALHVEAVVDVLDDPDAPGAAAAAAAPKKRKLRPAEVVLAHRAPIATAAAAAVTDDGEPTAIQVALASATTVEEDGTLTVDCDRVGLVEETVCRAIAQWAPTLEDLPAPAPGEMPALSDVVKLDMPAAAPPPAATGAREAANWALDLSALEAPPLEAIPSMSALLAPATTRDTAPVPEAVEAVPAVPTPARAARAKRPVAVAEEAVVPPAPAPVPAEPTEGDRLAVQAALIALKDFDVELAALAPAKPVRRERLVEPEAARMVPVTVDDAARRAEELLYGDLSLDDIETPAAFAM